jgi:hypothetical protein
MVQRVRTDCQRKGWGEDQICFHVPVAAVVSVV